MTGSEVGAENHRSARIVARLLSFPAQHCGVKAFIQAIKQEALFMLHSLVANLIS